MTRSRCLPNALRRRVSVSAHRLCVRGGIRPHLHGKRVEVADTHLLIFEPLPPELCEGSPESTIVVGDLIELVEVAKEVLEA